MTRCDAIGALIVGGRVVGQLRCDREVGHGEPQDKSIPWARRVGAAHGMTLEWTPEADPDLDLFDPAERFDVEVEIPIGGDCRVESCLLEGGHEGLHDDVFGPE